jgi:hypothetical protein
MTTNYKFSSSRLGIAETCTAEVNLTKIDRWFLVQIKEIVDFEEELAGARN